MLQSYSKGACATLSADSHGIDFDAADNALPLRTVGGAEKVNGQRILAHSEKLEAG